MAKRRTDGVEEPGFAAFLHLRDSTYLWNQDPDVADRALTTLAQTVEAAAKAWHAQIGNFTGDHFLVLFPTAEYAIRGLAEVIEKWEPRRQALGKALGTQLPDDYSLMVRVGVAHGRYRFLKVFSDADVAGEAANRARRCENASRTFFASAVIHRGLEKEQRIFVTQDVLDLVGDKLDYWCSERLPVDFKGYERPSFGGLATIPDHIVGVWPKELVSASEVPRADPRSLASAIHVASRVEIADRLLAAATSPRTSRASRGKDAVLGAIASYREALDGLPQGERDAERAEIHGKMGMAHAALAEFEAGLDRRRRLDEALEQFKSAIGLNDAEEEPEQRGALSFNIAAIRRRQAELVPPAERAHYLTDAVRSLRDVLQVPGFIADPTRYSLALGSLAQVLGNQADYLGYEAKEAKWTEAADVLRKALSVTTPGPNPQHYASLQSDLANALRMEAASLDSRPAQEAMLAAGESRAREAARALDAGATPSRYANAQVNLGLVLLDRARLANQTEAMLALAEAADAFKQALKVNDSREYWHKRATILENLSVTLQLQGGLLGGTDRNRHLDEARRTFEQAERVYREIGHVESADRVAKAVRALKG